MAKGEEGPYGWGPGAYLESFAPLSSLASSSLARTLLGGEGWKKTLYGHWFSHGGDEQFPVFTAKTAASPPLRGRPELLPRGSLGPRGGDPPEADTGGGRGDGELGSCPAPQLIVFFSKLLGVFHGLGELEH